VRINDANCNVASAIREFGYDNNDNPDAREAQIDIRDAQGALSVAQTALATGPSGRRQVYAAVHAGNSYIDAVLATATYENGNCIS
jgi:hypothetical protein